VSRKVVVLDSHQFDDNRISKHLSTVRERYEVLRINFNFYPGRLVQEKTKGAIVIDRAFSKNPYLNGSLFALRTSLGLDLADLEDRLRKEFIQEDDDIIFHVHDPYLLGLAVKLSKGFKGSRIVYDRHEYYETWKNRWGFSAPGLFERWYGGRVAEVIFVSREHSGLPNAFSGKHVSVVPNYPFSERFSREAVLEKLIAMDVDVRIEAIYFGVLNLNFDRDIRSMFDVMRSVMEANKNVRFTVAGRVYDQEACAMMDTMVKDFGDRANFLGEISYDEVVRRTQRAHLGFFLLRPDSPMWSEERPVSPNKVYEYLFSGTIPVIRATLDDREAIAKCSLTFGKSSSLEDIRDGLLELISERERMKRMMLECFDAGQEFTWEKVAPRYLECYERVFSSMDRGNQ
jgi:glycosyltransferase involved in cell wall biosynthesis